VDQVRTLDLVLRVRSEAEVIEVTIRRSLSRKRKFEGGKIMIAAKWRFAANGRDSRSWRRLNPESRYREEVEGSREAKVMSRAFRRTASVPLRTISCGWVYNNNYFAGEAAQLPSIDSIRSSKFNQHVRGGVMDATLGSVVTW